MTIKKTNWKLIISFLDFCFISGGFCDYLFQDECTVWIVNISVSRMNSLDPSFCFFLHKQSKTPAHCFFRMDFISEPSLLFCFVHFGSLEIWSCMFSFPNRAWSRARHVVAMTTVITTTTIIMMVRMKRIIIN